MKPVVSRSHTNLKTNKDLMKWTLLFIHFFFDCKIFKKKMLNKFLNNKMNINEHEHKHRDMKEYTKGGWKYI